MNNNFLRENSMEDIIVLDFDEDQLRELNDYQENNTDDQDYTDQNLLCPLCVVYDQKWSDIITGTRGANLIDLNLVSFGRYFSVHPTEDDNTVTLTLNEFPNSGIVISSQLCPVTRHQATQNSPVNTQILQEAADEWLDFAAAQHLYENPSVLKKHVRRHHPDMLVIDPDVTLNSTSAAEQMLFCAQKALINFRNEAKKAWNNGTSEFQNPLFSLIRIFESLAQEIISNSFPVINEELESSLNNIIIMNQHFKCIKKHYYTGSD